jgi:hypothetical protein
MSKVVTFTQTPVVGATSIQITVPAAVASGFISFRPIPSNGNMLFFNGSNHTTGTATTMTINIASDVYTGVNYSSTGIAVGWTIQIFSMGESGYLEFTVPADVTVYGNFNSGVKYTFAAPAPAPAPAGTKVSILLPIQVDFNQFGDITVRVEGEDVSYNYDLRLHYYSKVTDTKAVDLCNNVFKYNESTVSDALTDVSCSAPATLKALIKTALDASDISCTVPRKVYNLSGDMAKDPMTDNSGGLLVTRPALMKDYLRGWLYTHLYDIIGLAATTGSIDLDMSGFSEYISENLKTQLCEGANGAAIREFIFKAMFVQDPARFQNASGSSTAPDFSGQTLANKDLLRGMPFKAGDSLSFLIKFNFPKGNIKAPVQSTVLRLGTTTAGITVGEQTNITVSTKSLSNTIAPGDLFRDFRQCLVWLQVHIEH